MLASVQPGDNAIVSFIFNQKLNIKKKNWTNKFPSMYADTAETKY